MIRWYYRLRFRPADAMTDCYHIELGNQRPTADIRQAVCLALVQGCVPGELPFMCGFSVTYQRAGLHLKVGETVPLRLELHAPNIGKSPAHSEYKWDTNGA